ncbi:MAG: 2-oxo-4-hydroxy-4-carboxy-5-ureidoimidazoline decarboxylase [Pseudomonadota bacterium]|nr:2-oxo-4-hydroxy-4-carboxy-5-ureidoimidazoline decarboxylase [Pseudomonadota bacterium]
MNLDQVNQLDAAEFAEALAAIFEHSPWVAERTWARRPFATIDALHTAMCQTLASADNVDKLRLIRAHPKLAGKAAIRGELTTASTAEQSSAGLAHCSPEEFARISELNDAYDQRFGFPFILAVRGHTRSSITANMASRINNERDAEIAEALRQIERIAAFRLADTIG